MIELFRGHMAEEFVVLSADGGVEAFEQLGAVDCQADEDDPAVAAVLSAFRDVVVRRGDEAMAPGDLLPMTMPSDLQPAE